MAGLTLDTGALIGFERVDRGVLLHLKNAQLRGSELTVPTVVAEAWKGGARSVRIGKLLQSCIVEPLFEDIARVAGEALGRTRGATVVDAIVVASRQEVIACSRPTSTTWSVCDRISRRCVC